MKCKNVYLLFLFSCLLFINVKVFSQSVLDKSVTLEFRNVSLQRALKMIEEHTNIKFAYSPDHFTNQRVTISASNEPLAVLLRRVLGEAFLFETVGNVVIIRRSQSTAKQFTVNGIISDEAGTLPGVTVVEKRNNLNGTSTDGAGQFSLNLPGDSSVILIRALGYLPREIRVQADMLLNIRLVPDNTNLEEIVVVGFGTQRKSNVIGSVSTIGREDIQQTPGASLQNLLTGKLTGYFSQQRGGRPGQDGAAFVIRGVSTYNGNIRPLILVDDIEYSYDDFSNLDPNEIQSLSILKDAGSTAVYGIKGANGVILVTTRRGLESAPKINFRTEFGVQRPTHIPEVLGAADMVVLRNEALQNDAIISGGPYVPDFTEQDIELFRNGSDPYGHPDINWYKTLFKRTAPMSTHSLDVLGGTHRVKYFISLGYDTQAGLLREFGSADINNNYTFDRYNFRSNLDIQATGTLSFRMDLAGNNTITNQPQVRNLPFGEIYNYEALTPFVYPVYNPDGSFGFTDPLKPQPMNNIVGRIRHGGYHRENQNLLNLNLSAIQNLNFITPGLQLKITGSIANSVIAARSMTISTFPSFYYNPQTGGYLPRNSNVFRVAPYNMAYSGGEPRRQTGLQASLNYQRTFGQNHNLSGLVVMNQYSKQFATQVAQDPARVSNYIPSNSRGIASRLSYNYKSKYLVEATGAYNGSDRFAASRRYGFFPAALAGWVISEENFIKNKVPQINNLKLRISYGLTGSDDLGNFKNSYEEIYGRGGNTNFGDSNSQIPTIIPGSLANEQVSWEKERKFDLGIEFGIFKNKISGSATYFANRRSDILSRRNTIPSYFGIPNQDLPPLNLGIVSNRGYEFEFAYNNAPSRSFNYSLRANYSYAKNRILEIDEVAREYPWQTQTGQSIGTVPGYVWDGFYSAEEAANPLVPKYIGSTTASGGPGTTLPGFLKYRDLNGDGLITEDDMGYFGRSNLPTTIIGLNGRFQYQNISLNFILQSALNYDLQIGYSYSVPFKGNLQRIHLDRWTPEKGMTATFPSLVSNFHGTYMSTGGNSSFWAIRGDYLRIKSVELSYAIPSKFVERFGLSGARIFASGYNLYTWSASFKRYGVDPEVLRQSSESEAPLDYPTQAIFNAGVSLGIR